MDEFALCWNNFQDNIATGFQNLYDRGDLVDVTLACDGKLLQAHKIVLAICSPYFQEMFITNPCKHPIIILKDVSFTVMSELLQFMYQGEVNVKHSELSTFMKIAETLQIKGLTTTQKSPTPLSQNNNQTSKSILNHESQSSSTPEPRSGSGGGSGGGNGGGGGGGGGNSSGFPIGNPKLENLSTSSSSNHPSKRMNDYSNDTFSIFSKKSKRNINESGGGGGGGNDSDINQETIDNMTSDDVFLPPIPQISMGESRFDLNNVKRESNDSLNSPLNMRNVAPSGFTYEYSNSSYSGKNIEFPNDLHDFPKAFNHMDIPPGSNITMLSSTSLLHGSCIFNRNNTVATQQGMKTYWLCKSYRITMCRARCITHQGRVISATGVHNHQPHMKGANGGGGDVVPPVGINVSPSANTTSNVNNSNNNRHSIPNPPPSPDHHMNPQPPLPQQQQQSQSQHQQQQQQQQQHQQQQQQQQHQQHQQQQAQQQHQQHQAQQVQLHTALQNSHHPHIQQLTHPPQGVQSNAVTLHNMMHNVLTQNNLMHPHPLSSIHQSIAMGPLLNPLQQHSQINNLHPPTTLQITPIIHHNPNLQSPSHPVVRPPATTQQTSQQQQQQQQQDSPNIHHSHPMSSTPNNPNSNMSAVSSSPMASSTPNDENCVNIHQQQQENCSTSQSGLISSITISPTAPSFKMEHI